MLADRRVQPFKGTLRDERKGDGAAPEGECAALVEDTESHRGQTATKSTDFRLLSHCPEILMNVHIGALSSSKQETHMGCAWLLNVSPLQEKWAHISALDNDSRGRREVG